MDRQAALADFEAARLEWEAAFAGVPDAALAYLKPGDDYALGGLLVHVNWVLAHYLRVLDGQTVLHDPPLSPEAHDGLTPVRRAESLVEMSRLHDAVRTAVSGLDDSGWRRVTPVVYGPGEDPFPTTPEDVVGWLREHYREHVEQCADLIREWRSATAAG